MSPRDSEMVDLLRLLKIIHHVEYPSVGIARFFQTVCQTITLVLPNNTHIERLRHPGSTTLIV